jgi:hypothetical protein
MLFPRCGDAAPAWHSVAAAAHSGLIWCAKVAPHAGRTGHLICVYTSDFTELATVEDTVQHLADLGLIQRRVYYKPDIFTYAGIYAGSARGHGVASIYQFDPAERRMEVTAGLAYAQSLLADARRASPRARWNARRSAGRR